MLLLVYNNTLTATQKDKKLPVILGRDGNMCLFCEQRFIIGNPKWRRVIDHLNNNEQDNRVENLGVVHAYCNEQKKNNIEFQVMASEKLKENTLSCESLSEGEKKDDTHTDELNEGDINQIINKLVFAELESQLPKGSKNTISYTQTLRGITYLVIKQTHGRGSETSVRRSIDAHCSKYAEWEDQKEGRGNRIIKRRENGLF